MPTPHCIVCRIVVCLLFAMLISANSIQAQITVSASVTDSSGKSVKAKVYIAKAIVGGFFSPISGAFDSLVSVDGRFAYTFDKSGAYAICIRANNQKYTMDIPFLVEKVVQDSVSLGITLGMNP
jgi:hypothetical protein